MKYIIYKITNVLNNKCYIGQTYSDVRRRWVKHCSKTNNSIIANAIRKYGRENFKLEIIASANNLENLNELEVILIKQYNSLTPSGYNLEPGGRNCKRNTEAMKRAGITKRGMAYKNRRRGVIGVHRTTKQVIIVDVVKDFMNHGFTFTDLSNIRSVLSKKSKTTYVKNFTFMYKSEANQILIKGIKNPLAEQRIVDETVEKQNISNHETPAPDINQDEEIC